MRLTVKLFATFRVNRFSSAEQDYPEGTPVGAIIDAIGIDRQEVGITMLNSRHCRMDTVPQQGDVLAIFPVIGGG
ncbi:MoaD/ThiS family protein [Desulfofustis limnaeus]|jgi:molybdopterin converting factor small subunit|uniref:MoaD/ThiS family protein n=1 Tax=Desulfofustis limnaeus TaxID=2740163 RepID=A0ABN6M3E6_9BACT|nr:MoaD/ThiS family protein [Desulfofustis limnaeus]MDX9895482.1 MoaD/ThiS family protein [Desulfofustis sp.]BDD87438.1 hypothetical protein DPPLL_18030 [Desulfofustis limnaeus]